MKIGFKKIEQKIKDIYGDKYLSEEEMVALTTIITIRLFNYIDLKSEGLDIELDSEDFVTFNLQHAVDLYNKIKQFVIERTVKPEEIQNDNGSAQ